MINISGEVLFVVIVLSGVAMLQFYKGRKINLALMQAYAKGFESKLKIKNQLYTWIGGYAGFKAEYDIMDKFLNKIEITLTLLSRQSFFWFPVSYAITKGDRLYIIIRPKFKIQRDAHIVKKFYYLFGAGIKEKLKRKEFKEFNFRKFYYLCEDEGDINSLLEIVKNSIEIERLRHIAFVKETNILYCLIKPDPNKTPSEIEKLLESFSRYFKVSDRRV